MDNKSLAEGSFLSLPPDFNLSKLRRKKKRKLNELIENPEAWEEAFSKVWNVVEKDMKEMNEKLFSKVLEDLVKHIGSLKDRGRESLPTGSLPCQLLLTGTNLPDHTALLNALRHSLCSAVTSHIATLPSQDCANVRVAVQSLVRQIVDAPSNKHSDDEDLSDEEEEARKRATVQRSLMSMATLAAWYHDNVQNKAPVLIILPDFESFSPAVLSDLISLLSGYVETVPLVLVLCVATSPAVVYQTLPRSTLSMLYVHLFHSEASPTFLNHVIEKTLLDDKCPFRLSGRIMTFLVDVFLFHSFSVQRFVQGFKYCMMEHFYRKNHMVVCCKESELESALSQLTGPALENLRKIPSFQRYVESKDLNERKALLLDNDYFKKEVGRLVRIVHSHGNDFLIVVKCLHILVKDLPGELLGRHIRELYCKSTTDTMRNLPEFRKTMAFLGMQARSELSAKISTVLDVLNMDSILDILSEETNPFGAVISKLEGLQKDLAQLQDSSGVAVNFEQVRKQVVNVVDKELVGGFLTPPSSLVFHELLYFDDLVAVRRRISGAPTSAIHRALNNPHHYLQCKCCVNADDVLACMPDLSICYKLYLECNKTINMFDWLQSFNAVVSSDSSDEGPDQQVQARFTRAVSELQVLGFIKPSRAKTDQVIRLTFGAF